MDQKENKKVIFAVMENGKIKRSFGRHTRLMVYERMSDVRKALKYIDCSEDKGIKVVRFIEDQEVDFQ